VDTKVPADAAHEVTALYQAHALGLVRLAVIMLGDQGRAEDVVQDAFFGLYRNWDSLADTSSALALGADLGERRPGDRLRSRDSSRALHSASGRHDRRRERSARGQPGLLAVVVPGSLLAERRADHGCGENAPVR
jgi:DNA-directed RNA polymerase specialized sigma24 family protein